MERNPGIGKPDVPLNILGLEEINTYRILFSFVNQLAQKPFGVGKGKLIKLDDGILQIDLHVAGGERFDLRSMVSPRGGTNSLEAMPEQARSSQKAWRPTRYTPGC